MKVYKAINAVQLDLSHSGISKDSTNTFDNYKFRGIDAVYNALSPLLAKHGLCILPRMLSRTVDERESQKGGALFYVTVDAEFDFVSAEDGTKHTVKTFGEAMDRGDKATNKAMSAAYKYAAFQAFAIPTEGDNDADTQTHEVKAKEPPRGVAAAVLATSPAIEPKRAAYLAGLAEDLVREADEGRTAGAILDAIDAEGLDDVEKIYLSTKMPAKLKRALQLESRTRHQPKKEAA